MTTYLPVNKKQDFVKRYARGEFGNAAPTWDTPLEFLRSGYTGLVHIRNRIAGGPTFYNVPTEEFTDRWITACQVEKACNYYISGMAPTEKTVLQGELVAGSFGPYLYYTQVKKPMRDALKEESHEARGLTACSLLQTYLDANSLEWIWTLYRRYPDHVIEFSTYSVRWGTLPNFNTVFWEVRNY